MNVVMNTVAFVFFLGSTNRSRKYILKQAQIAKTFILQTTGSEVNDHLFFVSLEPKLALC